VRSLTVPEQFSIITLKEWIEKEASTALIPVQTQAKKLLDETSQAIALLTEVCESLVENSNKEIEKRNMKLFNRARALNKLANLFIDRLAKLSVPEQVTYDTVHKYNSESQKTLLVTEVDIKNWFPRISPFFIMDRRKFLTVYDKAKQTFLTLNEFVSKDFVKTKSLQESLKMIGDLQSLENKLVNLQAELENIKNECAPIEEKIAGLEQKAGELKAAGPIDQLNLVTNDIETLNNDLKTILRHFQKPFIKMQALSTSGGGCGITPDELRMINLYLDKPFEALIIEEKGCPTLNRILEKLQVMLKDDKLKLKPDKARKAEQSITEILDRNILNDLQEKSKILSTKKEQLITSARMDEIKQNISLFEDQTEQLKTRKTSIEAHETIKKREHQDLQSDINNRKRAIERNIAETFTKTIKII
jgi:hypothetical protein